MTTEPPTRDLSFAVSIGGRLAARGPDVAKLQLVEADPGVVGGADELVRRTELWGVTSWSTHGPSADALMQVAAAHRESLRDGSSSASVE